MSATLCGSPALGGPCILKFGHNMGKADVPSNHDAGEIAIPPHKKPTPLEIGRDQMIGAAGNENVYQRLVQATGIYGLSAFIEDVIAEHYPPNIFEAATYGINWPSEHAGEDIQPGVKWVTLLRLAVKEIK